MEQASRSCEAGDRQRPGWRLALSLVPVLLLPVVLVAPALRPGLVLSTADVIFSWHLFATARPAGYAGPTNGLVGDPVMQFWPWRRFATQELRAGRLPFWNPHAFAGSPLLGNSQSAVLDPLAVPYYLTGHPTRAALWVVLLRLWVAGVGAWVLARRLGLSLQSASLVGICYGCGGFLVVWALYPNASSAAWLPWLILGGEQLARQQWRGGTITVASSLAATILGGQVEVALFSGLGTGLFAVGRAWQLGSGRLGACLRAVRWGFLAAALGLALAAVHVVPFLGALAQGTVAGGRAQGGGGFGSPQWFPWDRLVLQLFPFLYGRPVRGEVVLGSAVTNFCEHSGNYLSVAGFLLALVGALGAGRASPARPMLFLWLVFWLYSSHFAPFTLVAAVLPGLGLVPPQRSAPVSLLAGAVLAGFGLEHVRVGLGRRLRRVMLVAAGLLLAMAALAGGAGGWTQAGTPGWQRVAGFLGNSPVRRVFAGEEHLLGAGFPHAAQRFGAAFLLPWGGVALVTASVLLLAARRGWAAGWVVVVAAIDLFLFGRGFNPALPVAHTYPESTPAIAALREAAGGGRVLVLDWGLPANLATYYGLDDIIGYDAINRQRMELLLHAAGPFPPGPPHFTLAWFDRHDSPVVDLLSVRAVASSRQLPSGHLRLVAQVGPTRIYTNPRALPRAFVPRCVLVAPDLEKASTMATSQPIDPYTCVIVEVDEVPPPVRAGEGRVSFQRPSPGRLELQAAMSAAGVVVVSEAFDPGWSARVDGNPTRVYPCDLALLAVMVPEGEHVVQLAYRPPGWYGAVATSLAALLGVVGWGVLGRRRGPITPTPGRPPVASRA